MTGVRMAVAHTKWPENSTSLENKCWGRQKRAALHNSPRSYNSDFMETGLKGRVAIIAGSSQGIGLATAEAFAAEGCHVAMCARNSEKLGAASKKIRTQSKSEVLTRAFDVTDAAALHSFVEEVANQLGRIDTCVANA